MVIFPRRTRVYVYMYVNVILETDEIKERKSALLSSCASITTSICSCSGRSSWLIASVQRGSIDSSRVEDDDDDDDVSMLQLLPGRS